MPNYTPSALWAKYRHTLAKVSAIERDLSDLTHEAAHRKQLGQLQTAKRMVRDAGIILEEMSLDLAKQDLERNHEAA